MIDAIADKKEQNIQQKLDDEQERITRREERETKKQDKKGKKSAQHEQALQEVMSKHEDEQREKVRCRCTQLWANLKESCKESSSSTWKA